MVQFLAESVVISLAGAVIGAVLGVSAAYLTTAIIRSQTAAQVYAAVTWQTLAVSMGAAVAVGLVFGVYPAHKAARLSPVEAMRYEYVSAFGIFQVGVAVQAVLVELQQAA